MLNTIEETVESLAEAKTLFSNVEEVEEYLEQRSVHIDRCVMIGVLDRLIDYDIWRWIPLMRGWLPRIASAECEFLLLLRKIGLKLRGDLAEGELIGALFDIGLQDPELGFALHREMIKPESGLVHLAAFPLAGAGRTHSDLAFVIIREEFGTGDASLRSASIKAIGRLMAEGSSKQAQIAEGFELLRMASGEGQDVAVRIAASNAYFIFSKFDPAECAKGIMRLANQGNPSIRFSLASMLYMVGLPYASDEIELVKVCALDEDVSVLSQVCHTLALKGKQHPEQTLEIIKDWIKRGKYHDVAGIRYCLKVLGEKHLRRCLETVETWIRNREDSLLALHVPTILVELSSCNYEHLVLTMDVWQRKDGTLRELTIRTLREVLGIVYSSKKKHQNLLDLSYSLLLRMAKAEKIPTETTGRSRPASIPQCFKLIDKIRRQSCKPDFRVVYENLTNYPTIEHFLGREWFHERELKNNDEHPLLTTLTFSTPKSSGLSERKALADHLEEMLKVIISRCQEHEDIRAGLRNGTQFMKTISELEVISAFAKQYPVEIAPEIGQKKLDARVHMNGKRILIEVISPETPGKLRYSTQPVEISNRTDALFSREIKRHLKDKSIGDNSPLLLFMDNTCSEITDIFVEEYVNGTSIQEIIFDRETAEFTEGKLIVKRDSMHDINQATDVISAVISYRRNYLSDGIIHYKGRITPNPHARNPLSNDLVEQVKRAFFA